MTLCWLQMGGGASTMLAAALRVHGPASVLRSRTRIKTLNLKESTSGSRGGSRNDAATLDLLHLCYLSCLGLLFCCLEQC